MMVFRTLRQVRRSCMFRGQVLNLTPNVTPLPLLRKALRYAALRVTRKGRGSTEQPRQRSKVLLNTEVNL